MVEWVVEEALKALSAPTNSIKWAFSKDSRNAKERCEYGLCSITRAQLIRQLRNLLYRVRDHSSRGEEGEGHELKEAVARGCHGQRNDGSSRSLTRVMEDGYGEGGECERGWWEEEWRRREERRGKKRAERESERDSQRRLNSVSLGDFWGWPICWGSGLLGGLWLVLGGRIPGGLLALFCLCL